VDEDEKEDACCCPDWLAEGAAAGAGALATEGCLADALADALADSLTVRVLDELEEAAVPLAGPAVEWLALECNEVDSAAEEGELVGSAPDAPAAPEVAVVDVEVDEERCTEELDVLEPACTGAAREEREKQKGNVHVCDIYKQTHPRTRTRTRTLQRGGGGARSDEAAAGRGGGGGARV
jgi:hypothetical protein